MGNKWTIVANFVMTRWGRRFQSRQQLIAYQEKQLAKHLRFVQKNSAFYRGVKRANFPKMNKQLMMANFDLINTVGLKREEALALALKSEKTRDFSGKVSHVSVGLSSGTSGHQGLFITSEKEQGVWAGTILAKMLPKGHLRSQKIAFFMRADNNLYETIRSKAIDFRFFDMFHKMAQNVQSLNDYQPTILVAPVSVLLALAKFVEREALSITPIRVISVAEILEKRDAEYLRVVFNQGVIHQIYQCTEGFLGGTCHLGNLHLNEDIVQIESEYLDERRFYPIVTDFKRTSQPTVNYHLNDILVEAEAPCPCGSPLRHIEKIEGRSDDIFLIPSSTGQVIQVYPDFIRRCLLFVEGIREYQVIQQGATTIEVVLDQVTPQLEESITHEFMMLASELGFQEPTLTFTEIVPQKQGKLKRIRRDS